MYVCMAACMYVEYGIIFLTYCWVPREVSTSTGCTNSASDAAMKYPGSSHERAADTGFVMKWNLTMQSRALISTIAETLFAECVQSAGHKLPGRGSKAPFR